MRSLSSLIASVAAHSEHKPVGAWAAGLFVAVVVVGSSAAAFLIGNAMSATPAAAETAPMEYAYESF